MPPTVLAAHGMGLGPWVFDAWKTIFAEAGMDFRALTLPGHDGNSGNATFGEVVSALEEAVAQVEGPVVLLGHSFAALAAQVVATRRPLHAAVFVCPLPPGPLRLPRRLWRYFPAALASVLRGAPFVPSRKAWLETGFSNLSSDVAEAALKRVLPWPAGLVRDLRRPTDVLPTEVTTPVLVTVGGKDPVVDPAAARVVGDLFEGVIWRYDGLAHTPMLESGGERMARDIAAFCLAPTRPAVLESEGFGPDEGAGHTLRRARRGARSKLRSAYGQRKGQA